MNDTWKIVIGALISVLTGFVNYYIQHTRTRKIDQKSKMRVLVDLIKETIDYTKQQINSFGEFILELKADKTSTPSLKIPAHNSAKELVDRITSDEYYIGYSEIMTEVNNSDSFFFKIKSNSIFIHNKIQEIIKLVDDVAIRDNERRKNYVKSYKGLFPLVNNLFELKEADVSSVLEVVKVQKQLFNEEVVTKYDGVGEIHLIQSMIVEPILAVSKDSSNQNVQNFAIYLAEITSAYKEIIFYNNHLLTDIEVEMRGLLKALDNLENAYAHLSNRQVSQFFMLS